VGEKSSHYNAMMGGNRLWEKGGKRDLRADSLKGKGRDLRVMSINGLGGGRLAHQGKGEGSGRLLMNCPFRGPSSLPRQKQDQQAVKREPVIQSFVVYKRGKTTLC